MPNRVTLDLVVRIDLTDLPGTSPEELIARAISSLACQPHFPSNAEFLRYEVEMDKKTFIFHDADALIRLEDEISGAAGIFNSEEHLSPGPNLISPVSPIYDNTRNNYCSA